MRVLRVAVLLSTVLYVAACDALPGARSDELARLELERMELQELNRELAAALAERSKPVASAEEIGLAESTPAPARSSAQPVVRRASTAPTTAARRPAPRPRSEPLGRPAYEPGTWNTGTYSTPQPQPRVVKVKNTKRDAAIGAGAGAVLGATVAGRRSRVKGALIGAAVGAAAGAVVGSTIDTSTRVEY